MPFFDPPEPLPPPPRPVGPPRPRWAGPPEGVLGELVADRIEVVRTPDVHVALEQVRAYPTGFELRLAVRSRSASPASGTTMIAWRNASVAHLGAGMPGSPPRLGLGFPDGTTITNLSPALGVPDDAPGPLLVQLDAPGMPAFVGMPPNRYWVWGLPPPGPLTVAVEVPALGVPETTVDLDGDTIRAAAGRASVLWEAEPAPGLIPRPHGAPPVFVPEPRPVGPPPEDEAAARAAIGQAFAHLLEERDGVVVNVEGGDALGPSIRELHSRVGDAAATATHQVERVTFLDATSAAVVFTIWLGGSPYLAGGRGDAVFRDGRWLVARSTFCGLLANVGVSCP